MAVSVSLQDMEGFIRDKIIMENWTHSRISLYLKRLYPGCWGFSVRSIERFCSNKGIHRTSRLDASNLQEVVSEAIRKVSVLVLKCFTLFLRPTTIDTLFTRNRAKFLLQIMYCEKLND